MQLPDHDEGDLRQVAHIAHHRRQVRVLIVPLPHPHRVAVLLVGRIQEEALEDEVQAVVDRKNRHSGRFVNISVR